jgi:hypothetical protein
MSAQVALADRSLSDAVNRLRVSEYAKAGGFKVDPRVIEWNASDDESFILIVKEGERIVATMRAELADNVEIVEKKLECPWSFGELRFPVLLLSKAATDSTVRGKGLNTVLRYWSFRLAQHWGVGHLVGTFVEGSPRINAMREMGYEFFRNELGWFRLDYKSERPVLVAKLDFARHGELALEAARRIAGDPERDYPWSGNFPEPKFITRIK